jgi:hypothetical protein
MNWPQRRLGDLMEFRNGLSYSAADRGEGLAIVGVADVSRGGCLPSSGFEMIRTPGNLPHAAMLRPGDLLFVRSNGSRDLVGRCAEVGQLDQPTSHSGFTIRARVIDPEVNPKWVAAFFACGLGDGALGRGSRGTNINNLRQERLQGITIPCPPRSLQDRMVETFTDFDQQILLTSRLLAAHIRFHNALGEMVLTGAADMPALPNDRDNGERPALPQAGWNAYRLDAVADISVSNVDKKVLDGERAVRLCNYMDVWRNDYIEDAMPFMIGSATTEEVERFSLRPGDVLLTKDSETKQDIASTALVRTISSDVVLGYHLALIRPRAGLLVGGFLAKQLMLPRFRSHFIRSSTGATRYGLTLDAIGSAQVWLPSLAEQTRRADALHKASDVIRLLSRRVEEMKRLQKAAMRSALIGAHLSATMDGQYGENANHE